MIGSADLGLQLILNISSRWAVYATLALGFGLLYRSLRVFHVSYAALIVLPPFLVAAGLNVGLSVWVAVATVFAVVIAAVTGLDFAIFHPLQRRGASPEGGMIASLGIYGVVQSITGAAFGHTLVKISLMPDASRRIGEVVIGPAQPVQIAVGLAAITLFCAIDRSILGLQLRAIGDNPRLLALYGAPIARLRIQTWGCATLLAGAGGIMVGGDTGVDARTGMQLFLGASVAVFLGGIERPLGWLIAAFLLSAVENILPLWLQAKWSPTVVYAIALALLAIRPQGLGAPLRRPARRHD